MRSEHTYLQCAVFENHIFFLSVPLSLFLHLSPNFLYILVQAQSKYLGLLSALFNKFACDKFVALVLEG